MMAGADLPQTLFYYKSNCSRGREGVMWWEEECFVSHNYSPIIWSKYDITEHFVVQAAWLWSSCGRMCFTLEAPLWSMFPVTTRITVRSQEHAPPHTHTLPTQEQHHFLGTIFFFSSQQTPITEEQKSVHVIELLCCKRYFNKLWTEC